MRIIDTGITKEMLTRDNHPQLKVADKLYTVDDRQSTWDKIQEIQNNTELTEKERTNKIYTLALGEEATKEIEKLDLPVETNIYFSFCVMGAITGQDPKELQKIAKSQIGKN